MTGDVADVVARIKSVLPQAWFGDSTPILDSVLSGISSAWSVCYAQIRAVGAQARLSTAFDVGLDFFALDYFGGGVARNGQSDDSFRGQIMSSLLRPRGTRSALISVLQDLTGRAPTVFEPAQPHDTGAYAYAAGVPCALGYNRAGGWGSLQMPFQTLIVAYRPRESGIPLVSGWGGPAAGYGIGAVEYANLAMSQGQVADSSIQAAVAATMPVGTIGWMQISN